MHRRDESSLVQQGWVQEMGESTRFVQTYFNQVQTLGQALSLPVRGQARVQLEISQFREIDFQCSEILANTVMQFARNSPVLIILRSQQATGDMP
ncbi:MAG TPA: hypothetical protein VHQ22_23580 [Terriglobales bacterium]|nr:hypothetical protein [Terriglobales bacterium]